MRINRISAKPLPKGGEFTSVNPDTTAMVPLLNYFDKFSKNFSGEITEIAEFEKSAKFLVTIKFAFHLKAQI